MRMFALLIAGFLGLVSAPANAVVVTNFSLTFQTSQSVVVGTGTLGITDFVAGSTYGSGDAHVTEFDAIINGFNFNFLGHFSALVFSGNTLTAVTANTGVNPNTILFTGSGLQFQYFLNGNPQVLQTGTVLVSQIAPAVPEPSTWAMMILGFAGVSFLAYRRRKRSGLLPAA